PFPVPRGQRRKGRGTEFPKTLVPALRCSLVLVAGFRVGALIPCVCVWKQEAQNVFIFLLAAEPAAQVMLRHQLVVFEPARRRSFLLRVSIRFCSTAHARSAALTKS